METKLPTRDQLLLRYRHGSPEERAASKILMDAGFYREPESDKEREEDDANLSFAFMQHPLVYPDDFLDKNGDLLPDAIWTGPDEEPEESALVPASCNACITPEANVPEVASDGINERLRSLRLPNQEAMAAARQAEKVIDDKKRQWVAAKPSHPVFDIFDYSDREPMT